METSAQLRFDGRIALITGAGRGLGRAHARLLAARGALVIVNDIDPTAADAVVAEIIAAGGSARADTTDIAVRDNPQALVRGILATDGALDILVSNAGASRHFDVEDLDYDHFEHVLRLNTLAGFYLAQAAWPAMRAQGRGRIVLTSSSSGLFGQPRNAAYSAAKAALFGLTRSLALDGHEFGIHVNAIAPRAATRLVENLEDAELRKRLMDTLDADDVAPIVAWLSHDDCPISGEAFDVGGGWTRRIYVALDDGVGSKPTTPEILRDRMADLMRAPPVKVPADCYEIALDTVETPEGLIRRQGLPVLLAAAIVVNKS